MSQNAFTQYMAASFPMASGLMGDDITVNGFPVKAVTMKMMKTTGAAERGGGKIVMISGHIEMSVTDWQASGARQGSIIGHPVYGEMKIVNTPNEALSVVTVEVAGKAQ